MRDRSFTLEPAAETARPPFSHDFTCTRSNAFFWTVRDSQGRRVAHANTSAGARAAVRKLHERQANPGLRPHERPELTRADALTARRWTPAVASPDHG